MSKSSIAAKRAAAEARRNATEKNTAIHEAGHVIVGRVLGASTSRVSINGGEGLTSFVAVPEDADPFITAAGISAVNVILFGRNSGSNALNQGGMAGDAALLRAFDAATLASVFSETDALVKANKADIEAVADALMTRKALTGADITALLGQ
jgi:ATP-dependent Zn protease